MARDFSSGSSQYLELASAIVTGPPFSISAWFMVDDVANHYDILEVADASATSDAYELASRGSAAGDPLFWHNRAGGGSNFCTSTTAVTPNVWQHAYAEEAAVNSRRVLLNAGGEGSNSGSGSPANLDQTRIGQRARSGGGGLMNGRIAELCIWSAALDDDEITALAGGTRANRIRLGAIVAYWPLWGRHSPEIDLSGGGNSIALVNSPPQANHAPVTLYTPKWATVPLIEVSEEPEPAAPTRARHPERLLLIKRLLGV